MQKTSSVIIHSPIPKHNPGHVSPVTYLNQKKEYMWSFFILFFHFHHLLKIKCSKTMHVLVVTIHMLFIWKNIGATMYFMISLFFSFCGGGWQTLHVNSLIPHWCSAKDSFKLLIQRFFLQFFLSTKFAFHPAREGIVFRFQLHPLVVGNNFRRK